MPGENLTRAEASERADLVEVQSYQVELDLSGHADTFQSSTIIEFSARTGSSTFVDLIAPEVTSIILNGRSLDPAVAFADSRIALTELGENNTLEVVARCRYMNTGEGLHRFVDPVDGETYLYSQFEVPDSRRVFAVFEQPDLKARFTFTITAPKEWKVITNSPVASRHPLGDVTRWSFTQTGPISSYVTAIVAGPYTEWRDELTSSDGRTIPLGVYCRASLAKYMDPEEIFTVTKQGFGFYEPLFKMPYPYAKYDQIFVPEFNAGAMENVGCVTHTEDYVFRAAVPEAKVERRAITVLHELAHMWFGDLVTMKWWNDLWLNESFAEYTSHVATVGATRWTDAWTTFSSLEKSWAYRQDQLPSTHPIVAPINDLEDVAVNFDGITYAKGASVLRQLGAWVGEEEFFTGVAAYLKAHAWGNTVLADLLTELEKASGRDLTEWSRQWLQESGVTTLTPTIIEDSEGGIARLEIEQSASQESSLRQHRLAVAGYEDVEGKLVATWRTELDVEGARTEVVDVSGRARPALLLINDRDLAYAKVRLDEQSLTTAANRLSDIEDSLARTTVTNALWNMTRDGEPAFPARRYVETVLTHIGAESSSTAMQVLLRQLVTTLTYYVDPHANKQTRTAAADRLGELTAGAAPGSDAQLQLFRASIALANTADQWDLLEQLYTETRTLPGRTLDTDLRWAVLQSLVAAGRYGEAEIHEAELADPTAKGAQLAAAARAAVPTPEAKETAWALATADPSIPNAVQRAIIAGFNDVHDPQILLPFAERYFQCLEQVWAERTTEIASNIVEGLYPSRLVNVETVDLIGMTDSWLASLGERTPALRRLVLEARDEILRAQRAQRADRA